MSRKGLFTLFVDNLPDDVSLSWFKKTFNNYGVVKEAFIPVKRSKIFGRKFGFVRYSCSISADVAIAKANGLRCEDKKLFVKLASFDQNHLRYSSEVSLGSNKISGAGAYHHSEHVKEVTLHGEINLKGAAGHLDSKSNSASGFRSFAQVLKGDCSGMMEKAHENVNIACIHVQTIGNGWLLRSAVAKIRKLLSTEELEKKFRLEKVFDVQIRAMGGRYVIITFPNEESRNATIKSRWVMNWFEDIKPWDGEQAKKERFVWLSCFGMPLDAWSSQTFKAIGDQWGHFLKVDDDSLAGKSYEKGRILIATEQIQKVEGKIELLVDGVKYNIRVEEDDSFRKIESTSFADMEGAREDSVGFASKEDGLLGAAPRSHLQESENSAIREEVSVVGETPYVVVEPLSVALDSEVSCNEVPIPAVPFSDRPSVDLVSTDPLINYVNYIRHKKKARTKKGIRRTPLKADVKVAFGKLSDDSHLGQGDLEDLDKDIDSFEDAAAERHLNLSNVEGNEQEGIQLCSSLGSVEVVNNNVVEHAVDIPGDQPDAIHLSPVKAALKGTKGKKKRKTIEDILGLSKAYPRNNKGGRNNRKCVVLRSAVAAAALSASVSSEGIASRNHILLNEAQAIRAINKASVPSFNKIVGAHYLGDDEVILSKAKALWDSHKSFGLGYDGDEEDVIRRIALMEAMEEERLEEP